MKILKFLLLFILIFSCKTKTEVIAKIFSPSENLKYEKSSKYIVENYIIPDSINEIEANLSVNNLNFISSNKNIFIFDKLKQKLTKVYKYKFDELKLELLSVEFILNKDKTKLLTITSSGQTTTALIFQIDLSTLEIDWLTESSKQISCGNYSNNSDIIALGTGYVNKNEENTEYYSSLFMIDSKTGKIAKHFEQGESVKQIKFSKDGTRIYAVLDWPHVDTFVWNFKNTIEKSGTFGKNNVSFYDVCEIDENFFVTIGSDGIYKWNNRNVEDYEIVYKNDNNGNNKIHKSENMYLLLDYKNGSANPPIIKYFDNDFKLLDSIKMKSTFNNVVINNSHLEGIVDEEKIIRFDIKEKTVSETIEINKLLKRK